jgi:hypothetical protein
MNFIEVYANPYESHIIDAINPSTGLTFFAGETEAELKLRYPNVVRMTFEQFQAEKAARQNTPIRWNTTDAETYNRMLGCLPPAAWIRGGFLVGEPDDHCAITGHPRFRCYVKHGDRFLVANRPMTIDEFKTIITATGGF